MRSPTLLTLTALLLAGCDGATPAGFTTIGAGRYFSCALTPGGTASCWGTNISGMLGTGANSPFQSLQPVPVAGSLRFTRLSVGSAHSCGLTGGGAAWCWGFNNAGQAGPFTGTIDQPQPAPVPGGRVFSQVTANGIHSCGLIGAGAAFCWGDNTSYQLGNDTAAASSLPLPVAGGLAFQSIGAGAFFSCGLTHLGAAYCWGANDVGQLGTTDTTSVIATPVRVGGGLTFTTLRVGGRHSCGLTAAGAVYCWGQGTDGQLGNADTLNQRIPVRVAGGLAFSAIGAGGAHSCGLTANGTAYCWGKGGDGQLGTGVELSSSAPAQVVGGFRFTMLSTGPLHTCAVAAGGVAYCWGFNYEGQLGDGTTDNHPIPVPVTGGP